MQNTVGFRLGDGRGLRHTEPAVDRLKAAFDGRTHLRKVGEQIGHAMLQRLEGRKDLAELYPLLQVVERRVEHGLRHAEHFGSRQYACTIEYVLQQAVAAAFELFRRCAIECDIGMIALVGQLAGGQRNSVAIFDQIEAILGRDHEQVGAMRFMDEGFLAGHLSAGHAGFDTGRIVTGAFVHRQGCNGFAAGQLRQPFCLLLVAAAKYDGAGSDSRGDQGAGGQGLAELFDNQSGRQEAEVGPAMLFRNDDPGPTHLRHRRICIGIIGLRFAAGAYLAEFGYGAFVLRPVARHITQHFLFFVENCHCLCAPLLLVVEHAKHALGDDVVLDLGRPAIDRGRLAEEPAAHGFQFAVGKLVAFPAQALKAADLDQ